MLDWFGPFDWCTGDAVHYFVVLETWRWSAFVYKRWCVGHKQVQRGTKSGRKVRYLFQRTAKESLVDRYSIVIPLYRLWWTIDVWQVQILAYPQDWFILTVDCGLEIPTDNLHVVKARARRTVDGTNDQLLSLFQGKWYIHCFYCNMCIDTITNNSDLTATKTPPNPSLPSFL